MKTYSLYIGIMAALALTACNSDDNALLPATGDDRVALQVTSGIETRAHDNVWDRDDQIGIFMLQQGENTVDTYKNVPYVTTDGSGTFRPFDTNPDNKGIIYLPTDGSLRDFIAYYPYQAKMADDCTYAINLADQSKQSAIDFMVADKVTDKSRTDASVNFVFSHKLSKIKLNISCGKGLTDEDLKGLKVKITRQHDAATYDVLTGTSPGTSGSANATITLLTTADGKSAEGIVLPSTTYDGMEFVFETASMGSYKWPLNQSVSGNKTFEAGKKYTYNITVNRTDIGVTSTINDWTAGNTENGNAE